MGLGKDIRPEERRGFILLGGGIVGTVGVSEFTEGEKMERQGRGLRAETGGALGKAGGGRGAEHCRVLRAEGKSSQRRRHSVGSGPARAGGWIVPRGSLLTFEKTVAREQWGETNREGGGQ